MRCTISTQSRLSDFSNMLPCVHAKKNTMKIPHPVKAMS